MEPWPWFESIRAHSRPLIPPYGADSMARMRSSISWMRA